MTWLDLLPSLADYAIAAAALAAAYVVFGIAGFGTALVAAPFLAHVMPVATIVPLLALLDCVAATMTGVRLSDKVARGELLRLVPMMVIGSIAGAVLLLMIAPTPMMAALGLFVVLYALYGLLAPPPSGHLAAGWAWPFGGLGGVFSAMFGSGGIVYAMYLARRLTDKDAIRATQNTLISLATLTRVVIFAIAGIYSDWRILVFALLLIPAMLAGMAIGQRVTTGLTREQFLRVLYVVLIAAGTSLLIRAWSAL